MKPCTLHIVACAALFVACSTEGEDTLDPTGNEGTGPGSQSASTVLECRKDSVGRVYKAFDGSSLVAARQPKALGVDRARVKPYPVLVSEIERVLGKLSQPVSATFLSAASSFELPADRWFEEPKATGVGISTYFNAVFAAALAHVDANPSAYASMPTTESAKKVCEDMAHKAWRRRPAQTEVDRCTELAVTKLGKEPVVKKRWAYLIAAVLSTADFLSY